MDLPIYPLMSRGSTRPLDAIADDYGDDAYGSDDSWVDDHPDLGEIT